MMKAIREHWFITVFFLGIWTAMVVTPPGAFLPLDKAQLVSSAQASSAPCVKNNVTSH